MPERNSSQPSAQDLAKRLFEALERGELERARQALDAGASPRAGMRREWEAGPFAGATMSALEVAATLGHGAIARELLDRMAASEGPAEDHHFKFAWTVALLAAPEGLGVRTMIEAVGREAIKKGCAREMIGWLARGGHELELRELLRAGASPELTETTSPLLWAAREGHRGCVQALIDFGGDVDEPDEDGDAPLAVVASKGYPEVVKMLLELGADPLRRGPLGYTALHAAARFGELECVRLLAPISDVLARTDQGERASMLARRSGCEESAALLEALELAAGEKKALEGELPVRRQAARSPGL